MKARIGRKINRDPLTGAARRVHGQLRQGLLALILTILPGLAPAQQAVHTAELSDDALVAAMITAVVALDVAIPIGFLPFPAAQYIAESGEFSANLALKALRPWLQSPGDVYRYPNGDNCSYNFYLPATVTEYEDMYGFIPFSRFIPQYDSDKNRFYLWKDLFGDLKPPRLYHANSTVRVAVRSVEPVRRFNQANDEFRTFTSPLTGKTTEFYYPIPDAFNPTGEVPTRLGRTQPARADKDGEPAHEGPLQVYFPVGEHTLEWTAATQLNTITDIVFPAILLAVGVLTEVKEAQNGLEAGKQIKKTGLADDVAEQSGSAADAAGAAKSKSRFTRIWEHYLTQDPSSPGPIRKEFRKAAFEKIGEIALEVVDKGIDLGVDVLEAETGDRLYARGVITDPERKVFKVLYSAAVRARVGVGMDAIKAALLESDNDDFVAQITVTLLQSFGLDEFVTFDTGVSVVGQKFIVWDNVPPAITIDQTPLVLEATDIGGTRRYRAIDAMREKVAPGASDNCGRTPLLISDAPELLPIGRTRVTWTARDRGPNPPDDGQDYAPTAVQIVKVVDTQPPLLLPPPSKVIEAEAAVSLDEAEIGNAAAVDLADVKPVIENNAPASFGLDRRSKIKWTATDGSGNRSSGLQWVTVKTTGTNTAPTALDREASTLTSQPVDIRIRARDDDVLDGRNDPLWFKIERQPRHGEFIAPLLPFFIKDYRTGAQDGLGDDFDPTTDELTSHLNRTYCEQGLEPPVEFAHNVRFVHVTDRGTRFLLDQYFRCSSDDKASALGRFSKWDDEGTFLGQIRIETNPDGATPDDLPIDDAFVIDRDGFLYYNTAISPSTSSMRLNVIRCETDFMSPSGSTNPDVSTECGESYSFTSSSIPDNQLDARSMSYARVDSSRGVIYLADSQSIFAFEPRDSGGVRYLGELGPTQDEAVIDDWFGRTPTLEVGSDGSLYVADTEHHRIHKLEAVMRNRKGEVTLGEYVGWAGRCTGSGNKACDDDAGRSRGYSCTFAPDSCSPTLADLDSSNRDARGPGQGQFDTPRYIAIDPNDVLYIADYENERVQRLSRDGSFAGEAVSDGSGINKGDRPSFVLGNMGKPESVSVNSSRFYVVDRDERFVHVFGTLPFKEIEDDRATVTYVSDNNFHSATDSFRYSASDGLADSKPAVVRIQVDRNYRPPMAVADEVRTDEDVALAITLVGDDPDGILGKDFNGLDTLSFEVTNKPRYGRLTGSGAQWTYTPDADFYGEDRLRFTVNDGRFTSPKATVTITVDPVNDPPVVSIEEPARAARGFPTLLNSTFTDDPSDGYEATLDWGDDTVFTTGGIVTEEDRSDVSIDGVAVFPPPVPEAEGRTAAVHTYTSTGVRTVELCLTDSGDAEDCDVAEISVENLVSLGVGPEILVAGSANEDILPQSIRDSRRFEYRLTIKNEVPEPGPGLVAERVSFSGKLPKDLILRGIDPAGGSCTHAGANLDCEFGDLDPGEEVILAIAVKGPGDLIFDEDRELEGEVTTRSPMVEEAVSVYVSTRLVADPTDTDEDGMSDAYERAYGLKVNVFDANKDLDGDGLTNREEYEARTEANNADTDGDGLSDFKELRRRGTDPLDPDSDGDGMPDGYEVSLRLDPNDASDAAGDLDGDGYTNIEEYESGNSPTDPNSNPGVDAAIHLIMDMVINE